MPHRDDLIKSSPGCGLWMKITKKTIDIFTLYVMEIGFRINQTKNQLEKTIFETNVYNV